MAGLMQWFQVTCPKCTGALQVRLPEGVTSVQCSQCKAVFAVQVQPVALAPPGGPVPPVKRSRKRKKDAPGSGGGAEEIVGGSQAPRTLSAYNVFMKSEVAKVKMEHPSLPHREAFKLAAERWQASPMNPQNGGDRFPLKASESPGGVVPLPTGGEASAVAVATGGVCGESGAAVASGDGGAGAVATPVGGVGEGEEDGEEDGEEGEEDGADEGDGA